MYSIEIKVKFRAGHRLLAPYIGRCSNTHGEFFIAIFVFEKETLDESGMVLDFGVVKHKIKTWIDEHLDHSYICHRLDEVGDFLKSKSLKVFRLTCNPTSENIAKLLFDKFYKDFPELTKVGIIESDDSSIAWFKPDIMKFLGT